jgi:hypothetical protein
MKAKTIIRNAGSAIAVAGDAVGNAAVIVTKAPFQLLGLAAGTLAKGFMQGAKAAYHFEPKMPEVRTQAEPAVAAEA